MELEEELFFKRFPAEKQEQVRQFVAYAQLMGLNGKDLVSIGGKLDRMRASAEWRHNKELIESTFTFHNVGGDRGENYLNHRWRIKTDSGSYTFTTQWGSVRVRSNKTGKFVDHNISDDYSLGSGNYYTGRRYAAMLDVIHGKLPLNF